MRGPRVLSLVLSLRTFYCRMASVQDQQIQMDNEVRLYLSNPNNVEAAAEAVLNDLIDSVVLGIVFEVHRAAKIGLVDIEDGIVDDGNKFEIDEEADVYIFGQTPQKKRPQRCICRKCKRSMAPEVFVRHISKCSGSGRCSERVANRQVPNNNKKVVGFSAADDDFDVNVNYERHRKKRDLNDSRRPKKPKKNHNGDITLENASYSDINSSKMNYDSMTNEEKKNLLMQICGVISVNTRKLCTRSMRCPQHSDEQRRAVRAALLNSQGTEINCSPEMLQVDVDSFEDGDGQIMRETLGQNWEQEHSNTSSPADSASTSSSSSKKREKNTKSQE